MPRFSVYQLGRGSDPVIVVGRILSAVARSIRSLPRTIVRLAGYNIVDAGGPQPWCLRRILGSPIVSAAGTRDAKRRIEEILNGFGQRSRPSDLFKISSILRLASR